MFGVGGSHDNEAAPICSSVTVIENAASAALALPSLTLMTMFEYVPALALVGVPDNWPVAVLNDAHAGRFAIENVSLSPSPSAAVGRNVYALPAFTVRGGAPLIVGALFGAAATVIANGASAALALPSLTLITTFA